MPNRAAFVERLAFCIGFITFSSFLAACGTQGLEEVSSVSEQKLTANVHHVWTQHYDNSRTGATLTETTLNTSNVNVSTFGKLFTRSVDDQLYAQPLYLAGVPIAGGTHNVVYLATVSNTLYAYDADDPAAAAPLAKRSLLDVAASGSRPVKNADVGQDCGTFADFSGNLGIVGTPVIDVARNTLYVVSRVKEPSGFVQRLHSLDVTTFADRPGSPIVITATVPGTGAGSTAGQITFNSQTQNQRPALLLSNGVVYIAWASQCDTGPYHGWVIGYDALNLSQKFVFNDTPDGDDGGIWQAGQGLAADSAGVLYMITGNGSSNARNGGKSYSQAFLKLDPTLPSPVVDWFTPFDVDVLNYWDADLGGSGAVLVPGTQLVLGGGKAGKLYLVDRNAMGHFQAQSDSQIVQSFQAGLGHIHGSPVYWNSQAVGQKVYMWSESDYLKAFSFDGATLDTNPTRSTMKVPDGMPGGMLSVSANGSASGSGIVWVGHPSSGDANHATQPGIVRAMDAENVGRELWNSNLNLTRDGLGNFAKFVSPVVANGKVYVATFSYELAVYGLLPITDLPTPSNGTGLRAEYFDTIDLSGAAISRTDASVNFDWGAGSPDPALGADTFSARWSGQVLPQFSQLYTFTLTTDDGARLWVDGQLLIDDWGNHGARDVSATISLLAGKKYDLKMEYYEASLGASAQLSWSAPSLARQVIPASQLFPASGNGTDPGVPGAGTGLQAQYFRNIDLSGAPFTRTDPTVNFDWGTGSPEPTIGPDFFSVRWSGQVMPQFSEPYTFTTTTDDGVRLWVNGALLVDNWYDHVALDNSGTLSLVAGQKYDLKLEYYEHGIDASAKLWWSSPSLAKQIVPASRLFPAEAQTAPILGTGTGLRADYFDTADFSGPARTRIDATVSFDWGSGSPDPSIAADSFSARWTGQIEPLYSQSYTFITASDDGVRLWINGTLVIDNWTDHGRVDNSGSIFLQAGQKYDLKLEYYENGGSAVAALSWSSASQAQQVVPQSQLYPASASTTGTGLSASYFDNIDLTNLVLTRTDPQVDFDWGYGSPSPTIQPDSFSVRWTGRVLPRFSELYTFFTTSDDGVRLWVNGTLLIDDWTDHGVWPHGGSIQLLANQPVSIKLEYYESGSSALASLAWSSTSQPREVIPTSQLFPQ